MTVIPGLGDKREWYCYYHITITELEKVLCRGRISDRAVPLGWYRSSVAHKSAYAGCGCGLRLLSEAVLEVLGRSPGAWVELPPTRCWLGTAGTGGTPLLPAASTSVSL